MQASYEMEIVMGAENRLLRWRHLEGRFCYSCWCGHRGRWLTWPALHTLPKFCLIPVKGGSFNFWEDKCGYRSEWWSGVCNVDRWQICLFFYHLGFHPHLANVFGKAWWLGRQFFVALVFALSMKSSTVCKICALWNYPFNLLAPELFF